jgi:hypothetical protein
MTTPLYRQCVAFGKQILEVHGPERLRLLAKQRELFSGLTKKEQKAYSECVDVCKLVLVYFHPPFKEPLKLPDYPPADRIGAPNPTEDR